MTDRELRLEIVRNNPGQPLWVLQAVYNWVVAGSKEQPDLSAPSPAGSPGAG